MCEARDVDGSRRRALITGASSGIGEAFALRYAERGYDLVLAARNGAELERVAVSCRGHGVDVTVVVADLSAPPGVEALGAACGRVDALVANAGTTRAAAIGTTDRDELDSLTYLLATGVVRLCEVVVPRMLDGAEGDVVVVSSIAAFTPMRKSGAYAAAKAYVTSYARSLSLEVADKGVRVVVVCPGYVRTNLHHRAGLGHLTRKVPGWMWLSSEQVVAAADSGLRRGRVVVVPGRVYRLARPFLTSSPARGIWRQLTRRT